MNEELLKRTHRGLEEKIMLDLNNVELQRSLSNDEHSLVNGMKKTRGRD